MDRKSIPVLLTIIFVVLLPALAAAQATITIDASDNLTYQGSGVANALTISYSGGIYTFTDPAEVINVTNSGTGAVTGSGTNTVTVTNVASINADSGSGVDVITLESSSAINISFDTAVGLPDDVVLGNGTTANILGNVSVDDAGGVGYLTINASTEVAARTVTIQDNLITGATPNPVTAVTSNVTEVDIYTGSGNDSFTSTSWGTGWTRYIRLYGGGGSDEFNVTAWANPDTIVVGGAPAPPASPGDVLNIDLGSVTNSSLSGTNTASGYEGTWNYDGGYVSFSEIETYTPLIAAQINVVSGGDQIALVGTEFADPLVVEVLDAIGIPVPGVDVTFTPPGTGASASSTSPAATDSNGQTQVTATANTVPGTYDVDATVDGVTGTAAFTLTNAGDSDLVVAKVTSPTELAAGEVVTWTVSVTNNGPAPAEAVTLTDDLSDGVLFLSATPSQGDCTEAGGVVTCDLLDIAVDQTVTVDILAETRIVGEIANEVSVTGNFGFATGEATAPAVSSSATEVPVDNPVALGLMILVLAIAGAMTFRRA